MLLQDAIDEFILYIEIEKNYSKNTVSSYSLDLKYVSRFSNCARAFSSSERY